MAAWSCGGKESSSAESFQTPSRSRGEQMDCPKSLQFSLIGVVEKIKTKRQVLAGELWRQMGKGIRPGDTTPRGAIQGHVPRGQDYFHAGHAAVLKNGKFDRELTPLHDRRPRHFWDQVVPVLANVVQNALKIRSKVHAHGVA